MRVLLVKPKSWTSTKGIGPPLGIGYIAAFLLQHGHEVRIADLMVAESPEAELKAATAAFRPGLVGVTSNSHERLDAFAAARWAKEAGAERVAIGGPHISALGFADQRDLLQRRPEVDFLVPFEGEYPMLGLCEALEHGGALESVQGLVFRKAGEAVATPQRKFVDDLDALPFPARHLMRIEKYRLILPVEGEPQVTNIVTSRGCPFRCNFCSATQIAGYSIRVRSPENTLAEVAEIMAAYKHLEGVFFYDDNFLVQRKRAVAMCEAIKKSGIDFRWGCYGRVDLIDDELAGILAGAGCEVVSFGVESGSPKVLQAMNKRTTPAQVYAAVKAVKKHGMAARSSFFFGYPGEGIADLLRTFRLMHKAKLTAKEITFGNHPIIYPGTGLYEAMKERHYLPEGFSWAEPTDLPCFKDVPIFLPPHDGVRQALIKALWAAKRWGIA